MIRLWERFKGWRRGEKMIPGAARGRCFVRENEPSPPAGEEGVMKAKATPKLKLVGMKVIRANGDIEEIQ